MRLMIGTLYTIENEFDECVAAIKRQSYRNFEHVVFKGLPKKEAHHALFSTFREQAHAFDLLIKVDADMVLCNDHVFAGIVREFRETPSLEVLAIAVHDFYADRLIESLNTYRNTLQWGAGDDDLFTDAGHAIPGAQGYRFDTTKLAPAAIHCKSPSPFQAFHFGIHKALKALQPRRAPAARSRANLFMHWPNIELTRGHFERSRDSRLGFAVLGAELGLMGRFKVEHLDYSNPFAAEVFAEYETLSVSAVEDRIRRLRASNWGLLPPRLRRELLWHLNDRNPLGPRAVGEFLQVAFRSLRRRLLRMRGHGSKPEVNQEGD